MRQTRRSPALRLAVVVVVALVGCGAAFLVTSSMLADERSQGAG